MSDNEQAVDPEDFLRALLKISPEDAAKAREAADHARQASPELKAASERLRAAEKALERFTASYPLAEADVDGWPEQKRAEYRAALDEREAAKREYDEARERDLTWGARSSGGRQRTTARAET